MNNNYSPLKYRADIDGLRAFAVLLVVFFHAFPSKLSAGFIGVDIFFVISGYLISTIILSKLENNHFSFLEFYGRRIKRIYPALLLVLFSCLMFGYFSLLGDEYRQLGKHTLGGNGFVSNLILWSERGYFDNAGLSKPLLHLWSLGVEEQFYIVWPFILYLAWRSRVGVIFSVSVIMLISFYLNVKGINNDVTATFYSPITRFWELAIGGILAYYTMYMRISSQRLSVYKSNMLSIMGFTLIFLAIFFTKESSFPGWWALLPVLGSVLIIGAGESAFLNRVVLSNRVVVWFGLISYPIYLWHWPLLSFSYIINSGVPDRFVRILAILASILLAWLTYRFVEFYIRKISGLKVVPILIFFSLIQASFATYVFVNNGLLERDVIKNSAFNERVRNQFMGSLWKYTANDICLDRYPYDNKNELTWWFCMQNKHDDPTIILLGNSFANQLYPGFINNEDLSGHTILSIGTCSINAEPSKEPSNPCYGSRLKKQELFIDNLIKSNKSLKYAIVDGLSPNASKDKIEKLKSRIDFLENEKIKVIVFTPHIQIGFNPKACFKTQFRDAKDCSFSPDVRQLLLEKFKPTIEALSQSNPDVLFFEQNEVFCDQGKCSYILDGMPLHRDSGHTSEYGSIKLQTFFTEWARSNAPGIFEK